MAQKRQCKLYGMVLWSWNVSVPRQTQGHFNFYYGEAIMPRADYFGVNMSLVRTGASMCCMNTCWTFALRCTRKITFFKMLTAHFWAAHVWFSCLELYKPHVSVFSHMGKSGNWCQFLPHMPCTAAPSITEPCHQTWFSLQMSSQIKSNLNQ